MELITHCCVIDNPVSRGYVLMLTKMNLLNRVPEHDCLTFSRATENGMQTCLFLYERLKTIPTVDPGSGSYPPGPQGAVALLYAYARYRLISWRCMLGDGLPLSNTET